MISKWQQFCQGMIEPKSDYEELNSIITFMKTEYNLIISREPILLFDKDTCMLVKVSESITKWEYNNHIVHTPDILFYINSVMWVMEKWCAYCH